MPVIKTITPTQSDAQTALAAFLADLFPGAVIIAAQANRVPEPHAANFILMSPLSYERQATNTDGNQDVRFTGSIAAGILTVSAVQIGTIVAGMPVIGPAVAFGTLVGVQLSGTPGGAGSYSVSPAQAVGSRTLSGGTKVVTTSYTFTCQLDFHSADYTSAAWAQTFSNLFRDEYACAFFASLPTGATITPLYSDDAHQRPFVNDQQQYEWRWVVDAKMQVDQTVTIPQTYDDAVALTLVFVP
jgi:hypothetical protein